MDRPDAFTASLCSRFPLSPASYQEYAKHKGSPIPNHFHDRTRPVSIRQMKSNFRQGHAVLSLIFSAAIFIGNFAYFVGFKENHLSHSLVRVNLGRQRCGV